MLEVKKELGVDIHGEPEDDDYEISDEDENEDPFNKWYLMSAQPKLFA
jgi:hypothetical protein